MSPVTKKQEKSSKLLDDYPPPLSDKIKELMWKYLQYLIFAVIAISVLYGLLRAMVNTSTKKIEKVDSNVTQIQASIDSVNLKQSYLIDKLYELEAGQSKIDSAVVKQNTLLQRNNQEIQRIKKLQNENNTRIGGYNYSQLDSFFSKRYKASGQ